MNKKIFGFIVLALLFSAVILSNVSGDNTLPDPNNQANWQIYRPDPKLTPGVVDQNATIENLCRAGYTSEIRVQTTAIKKEIFRRYGINWRDHSMYEDDHLISLTLGGTNDIENRFPQYYCPSDTAGKTCFGAREKDVVENYFHKYICSKDISKDEAKVRLKFAQEQIVKDWFSIYRKLKGF